MDNIERNCLEKYVRAANYLCIAQVYLLKNHLLARPLEKEDIKNPILGHWGTCPGINFLFAHLNYLASRCGLNMMPIVGAGHAAPAVYANLYLDGSLAEYYPQFQHNKAGLEAFISHFADINGFATEIGPHVPGTIYQGGELGYSLAVAFGAVQDNPDLIVPCIVGDGEAETGPLAIAWHATKYLDPGASGAVLPILHLNGYKIASPTIYGTMDDKELYSLFEGLGYWPRIVTGVHQYMFEAIQWAYQNIKTIQDTARQKGTYNRKPKWPMLILRTPKGWTGIKQIGTTLIEGTANAHKAPINDAHKSETSLRLLEEWLLSYKPDELFDPRGKPVDDILRIIPSKGKRFGENPNAYGGKIRKDLIIPESKKYSLEISKPGNMNFPNIQILGDFFKDLFKLNEVHKNFRLVSPDELEANGLGKVLKQTGRCYSWPVQEHDANIARDGRVMEMLSEHTCESWLEGYILTGRHGFFVSFEAFIPIIQSMLSQHLKFLKKSSEIDWRLPISSLNYLLSSLAWRNCYSHQNPEFINAVLAAHLPFVRIYLPPDANTLLACTEICLKSKNRVNAIFIGKTDLPQWLSYTDACRQAETGIAAWDWVGGGSRENPDIILAASGDYPTTECIAAVSELKSIIPGINIKFVSVSELTLLGSKEIYPHAIDDMEFQRYFAPGRPVIFNFHGYPSALKSLLFDRSGNHLFHISGYIDEGQNTTAFDMQIRNSTSRYHLIIKALEILSNHGAMKQNEQNDYTRFINSYKEKIMQHRQYILKNRMDPKCISQWTWS